MEAAVPSARSIAAEEEEEEGGEIMVVVEGDPMIGEDEVEEGMIALRMGVMRVFRSILLFVVVLVVVVVVQI